MRGCWFTRAVLLVSTAGLLVLATGCATPTAMSSSVKYEGPVCERHLAQVLQVSKAGEGRPGGGASRIGIGFITFIPLVPYAHQRFTPERYYKNATMMDYNFKDDLAQTIVKDLTAAGVAQTVGYDSFGNATMKNDGPPRVELTLKEGVWNRNFTTYGCSFMGVYLWLVGLPVSYGHADMAFEAVVRSSDGSELGRKTFEAQLPLTESAYNTHKFPRRLPMLYEQISPGFRRFVSDCLKSAPYTTVVQSDPPPQKPVQQGSSLADRLKELKELKDSGIISEEEYQAKRKKLMDAL